MTEYQKEQVIALRRKGLGYKKTAQTLGLSVDAVKSFCRRSRLTVEKEAELPSEDKNVCLACGKPIVQPSKRKSVKFCCQQCREKWWGSHRDRVKKRDAVVIRCPGCGKEFSAYRHEKRKYCSHACYVQDRFKGGVAHV